MSQVKDEKLSMALSVVHALKPRWFSAVGGDSKCTDTREMLSDKEQKCYDSALDVLTESLTSKS